MQAAHLDDLAEKQRGVGHVDHVDGVRAGIRRPARRRHGSETEVEDIAYKAELQITETGRLGACQKSSLARATAVSEYE